jgi:hypothetical protein
MVKTFSRRTTIAVLVVINFVVYLCVAVMVVRDLASKAEVTPTAVAEARATATPIATAISPTATPIPPTATPIPTLTPTETPTTTPTATPTPTDTPVVIVIPTSTDTPTVVATATPVGLSFAVEYLGCQPHDLFWGSVKGQIFDRQGGVIPGAKVKIWIDGHYWDDAANPAPANQDGWYEWVLALDQVIRLAALYIDNQEVAIYPDNLEVPSVSWCFHHVNFRQQ